MHGGALVVNHVWRKRKVKMPRWLGWFITFNFINLSFVFFRAKEWRDAVKVLDGMFGLNGFIPPSLLEKFSPLSVFQSKFGRTLLAGIGGRNETYWGLIICLIFVLVLKNSNELTDRFQPTWKTFVFLVAIAFYTLLNMGKVSEFLYFQF
jgi:hypothetical protein